MPLTQLDSAIQSFRLAHTESGPRGVPPHVTLLFPFAETSSLTTEHTRLVTEIVRSVAAFDVEFVTTAYLPGSPRILYLPPVPSDPFDELTHALTAAFPEHPPYEGEFEEPVPHVTVAIARDDVLADVERALMPLLPRRTRVTEAWLIVQDAPPDRWRIAERFPLR